MKVYIAINNVDIVKAMSEQATRKALEAWSLQVQEYAAAGAPVDTGRLKNSITHKVYDNYALVGSDVEYAIYQELGTSRGVTAKHFLKNACMDHIPEYKKILESYFGK